MKKNIKNVLILVFLTSVFSWNLYSMEWISSFFHNKPTGPTVEPPLTVSDPQLSDEMEEIVYGLCPKRIKTVIGMWERNISKHHAVLLYGPNSKLKALIPALIAKKIKTKIVSFEKHFNFLDALRENRKLAAQKIPCVTVIENIENLNPYHLRPINDELKDAESKIVSVFISNKHDNLKDLEKEKQENGCERGWDGFFARMGFVAKISDASPDLCKKVVDNLLEKSTGEK